MARREAGRILGLTYSHLPDSGEISRFGRVGMTSAWEEVLGSRGRSPDLDFIEERGERNGMVLLVYFCFFFGGGRFGGIATVLNSLISKYRFTPRFFCIYLSWEVVNR